MADFCARYKVEEGAPFHRSAKMFGSCSQDHIYILLSAIGQTGLELKGRLVGN